MAYYAANKPDIPAFNYTVDFIELSKTTAYKDYAVLETVNLGDTVTIRHLRLNMDLKAEVIEVVTDAITGRITGIQLGDFVPNLANSINNTNTALTTGIAKVTTDYHQAITDATALITGSNGGNVVISQDANGKPYRILIMDTPDELTAKNVWCWSEGCFGYSPTGIDGPYTTAITQDGHIIASFLEA
jgi:phage-related protein